MQLLLITAFMVLQPTQADTAVAKTQVVISSDLASTPHAEPHLSINPNNPDDLLVGAIVLPDSTKHRVDAFRSLDGGNSWNRKHLPIADSLSSIDPWTSFDLEGNAYLSVLAPTTFYPKDKDMGFIIYRNGPNERFELTDLIKKSKEIIEENYSYNTNNRYQNKSWK